MKTRFVTVFTQKGEEMYRITPTLRLKALGALVVLCVAVLALKPGTAFAASEIGVSYGPEVFCNVTTNTISVSPYFSAGDAYTGQWLSYRFWALNKRTGNSFWLSAGGRWASPVWHQRVGEPYRDAIGNWMPAMDSPRVNVGYHDFPITGLDGRGAGEFYVYAEYAWYSPARGWLMPGTNHRSNNYNHIGLLYVTNMTYCQL